MTNLPPNEMKQRSQPAQYLFLLLPLCVIVPVTLLSNAYEFDGLYGQDAYAYFRYATGTLRQHLQAFKPPPPFFWPPGYPLLVALLSFVVGARPFSAQIISLATGALVPLFTALLAYELSVQTTRDVRGSAQSNPQGKHIALLAGLFVALMPQLWQSSAVSMSDTTALACATFGAWALLRYARAGSGAWLALATAAMSYAILTRMAYAPAALVCAAYAASRLAHKPRPVALAHILLGSIIVVIVLSPVLHSLWQHLQGTGGQAYLGHLKPSLWRLRHAFQHEFVTGNGRQTYQHVNILYYALAPAHRYYFTPLLAPLLLPGLWQLWQWRNTARVLLLAIWPLSLYILLVGYPVQNFRFTLAFLPPLAILLSMGVLASLRRQGHMRVLLIGLVTVALSWMVFNGWRLTEDFMIRKQANLATVNWAEERVAAGAQLFTFEITLAFEQYSQLEVHDLYNITSQQIAALLQEGRPAYLLVDVEDIERQWAEHAPGRNYRWLQRVYGVQYLDHHRHFSLARISTGQKNATP